METREERFMTNRFLMSVAAAALIAGTGFAYAQGTGTSRDAPSTAQSAPSSAPSSATPMNSDKGAQTANTTQSEDKPQPGGAKNQRAQDDLKPGDKGAPAAKTTQSEDKAQPGGAKNQRAQDDLKAGQKMNNAQSKEGMTKDGMAKDGMAKSGAAKDGVNNAQSKPTPSGQTTGNAATSATAAPPPEKQSQIASAIKQERVEEVTN